MTSNRQSSIRIASLAAFGVFLLWYHALNALTSYSMSSIGFSIAGVGAVFAAVYEARRRLNTDGAVDSNRVEVQAAYPDYFIYLAMLLVGGSVAVAVFFGRLDS